MKRIDLRLFGERLRKLWRSPAFILYLFWAVLIVVHLFVTTQKSDDAWFLQILEGSRASFSNWWSFLAERYGTWSSRVSIEGLLILCVRFPIIWRIADAAICIFLSAWLSRLWNPEESRVKNCISVAVCLVFPYWILHEVGYVATTLNYLWPLAAAALALTPAIKQFLGRDVRRLEYALAFPALFFACFQELLCAVLVLCFLGSLCYCVFAERKTPIYQLSCLGVCAVMLIFALTCPGNANRTLQETLTHLPEHASLSLLQKIEFGFSSMAKTMFCKVNVFVFVFCAVVALAATLEVQRLWKKLLVWIPCLFLSVFGLFGEFLEPILPPVAYLRNAVGTLGTEPTLQAPITWIPDLVFALLFVLILYAIRQAVRESKDFWSIFFLLAVGAASRIAMGLSPTVWASGERTCTFLYVCMAVVALIMLYRVIQKLQNCKRRNL